MVVSGKILRSCTLVVCCAGVALWGRGQEPQGAGNSATAAVAIPAGKAIPTVSFHSDLLDLGLAYPASLSAQTLPSLKEQHDAIAARPGAGASPDDHKSDACTDKALVALRNDEAAKAPPGEAPKAGTSQGASPHAITAKILISRMGVDCMPDSYKQQLDNVATAMSAALAQDRDLHPIDQPIWYPIGNTRVHFAAGENAPAANAGAAQAAKGRWVGSAAFVWGGNLVSVVVESNDLHFFNEMLHSKLTLGKQPASALFPADIGQGKPIQPKDDEKDLQ
jgi:hypothetical protein